MLSISLQGLKRHNWRGREEGHRPLSPFVSTHVEMRSQIAACQLVFVNIVVCDWRSSDARVVCACVFTLKSGA